MIKHLVTLRAPAAVDRGTWARELAALADSRFRWYAVDLATETDELLTRGRREGRAQAIDALLTVWSGDDRLDTSWLAEHGDVLSTFTVIETVHWDDGASATVKQVAFTATRRDLTVEEFASRYREHASVAREHHPGIRRYVQNLVMRASDDDACAAVAELWFDDENAYRDRFYRDDTSPSVVAVDVERFLDRAKTSSVIVVEVSARRLT